MRIKFSRRPHFAVLTGTALLLMASPVSVTTAQEQGGRFSGRLAPPGAVTCDRNFLTSWTGTVSDYHRDKDRTHLTINTDENTVEKVRLNHDGAPDAAASYLLWGEPFSGRDWLLIEQAPGVLIDGMRATVWVCESDGIAPIVDWQPAPD